MAKEDLQINSGCQTELHDQHLCYIISQGFNLTDEQEYKVLVEDTRYICNHCNRKAKSDVNLCVPTPL